MARRPIVSMCSAFFVTMNFIPERNHRVEKRKTCELTHNTRRKHRAQKTYLDCDLYSVGTAVRIQCLTSNNNGR